MVSLLPNLHIVFAALFISSTSFAAAPSAKSWAASLETSADLPSVVFVTDFPAGKMPTLLKSSSIKNKQSFINIVSRRSAVMALKLNEYHAPKTSDHTAHIKELNRLLSVTQVVHAPAGANSWTLYSYSNGKAAKVGSYQRPKSLSWKSLNIWLVKLVRYQGVVIDSKDGYLLVATYKKYTKAGTQAVTVKRSENKESIPHTGASGASIIQLENNSNYFGVFRVVMGQKNVPIGTKIQLSN